MGGVGNCLDCEARRFDHDFAGGVITAAAAQNMERTPYRRLFNSENVRKGSIADLPAAFRERGGSSLLGHRFPTKFFSPD